MNKQAGRGRKQCGKCKEFVGVRTLVCKCGSPFTTVASAPKTRGVEAPEISQAVEGKGGPNKIYAAPGKCPVKYDGDLDKWVEALQSIAKTKHCVYTATALGLWIREFVDPRTPAFDKIYDKIVKKVGED